jgi:glycosyltransferase involved in cell wall biosynthesis
VRILHAIHDFLPRHHAGSEIYAADLCRELAARHHVSILCAEFDPARKHGHVTWRVFDGLPVVEVVNNWACASFEETYRPPLIGDRVAHVLRALQPDVVHVHNLLNLTFDLPALAARQGASVVATLHDYTLVCPSGGQRIHQAERHVCREIDASRCARCFRESPFYAQMSFTKLAGVTRRTGMTGRAASMLSAAARRFPLVGGQLARAASYMPHVTLSPQDIEERMTAARHVFRQVDTFVAPSASIACEFERLGLDRSKIRVSDYGFVPALSEARSAESNGSNGPLRIGFVGTLVWHKGVHVLLDAVRQLPSSGYHLKIFGSLDVFPKYVSDLRARAAGLPVTFMGQFERDRAAEVYGQLDVLVVPSLWLENSPLVIHEAFMAGVPIVGARIGGIAGLVDDGRNGRLYDSESPDELGDILGELIANRASLSRLAEGVRASRPVKTIAEDAIEWEAVYARAIAHRAAPVPVT